MIKLDDQKIGKASSVENQVKFDEMLRQFTTFVGKTGKSKSIKVFYFITTVVLYFKFKMVIATPKTSDQSY